jgi:hypothetical protein
VARNIWRWNSPHVPSRNRWRSVGVVFIQSFVDKFEAVIIEFGRYRLNMVFWVKKLS